MSPKGGDAQRTETRISVGLGDRTYDIVVGRGLMARAGALAAPYLKQQRVFVVTDSNVAPLHLPVLKKSFEAAGIRVDQAIVPAGEQSKSFDGLSSLLDAMLAAKCERNTMIVALGGGVIGDLAGFAASILLRGVDFIQIPTTLLSQVDSSVGGKTGIDTPRGKNLVGAFHQPKLVLADTDSLSTLPRRQVMAGYAEVVKYGLLGDAAFFTWLQSNAAAALSGSHAALTHAIVASCKAKAAIVAEDERGTTGRRALLNLGHTFGHALEAEMGFGDELLHGEAVALGMLMAFDLSVRLGLCPAADAAAVKQHFAQVGLPSRAPRTSNRGPITPEKLIAHMGSDKKVKDGLPTFVLVRGIGQAFLTRDVPRQTLIDVLADALRG